MARGPRVYTRAVRLAEATSNLDTLSPSEGIQLMAASSLNCAARLNAPATPSSNS